MSNKIILGIDPGNYEVKIFGANGPLKFYSDIGEYRDLKLSQSRGLDDMVFEYDGRKGFAGQLARDESEFNGSIMGDTKAHDDAKLRVLLALHRYCENFSNIYLVTGQPIGAHTAQEKEKIINMLEGPHEITVNDRVKRFFVASVRVAAEGGAAYWSDPQPTLTRVLDIGGGTVNAATINERKRYVDKGSFTLNFGANTNFSNDLKAMSRGIAAELIKKWGKDDLILVAGGIAEQITPHLKEYFKNARVISPKNQVKPVFANALGFYLLGVGAYGR